MLRVARHKFASAAVAAGLEMWRQFTSVELVNVVLQGHLVHKDIGILKRKGGAACILAGWDRTFWLGVVGR